MQCKLYLWENNIWRKCGKVWLEWKCVAPPEMCGKLTFFARRGCLGHIQSEINISKLSLPSGLQLHQISQPTVFGIWLRESIVQRKHIVTLIRYLYLITGKHLITGRRSLVSTDGLAFQIRCSNYWSQASLSISMYRLGHIWDRFLFSIRKSLYLKQSISKISQYW